MGFLIKHACQVIVAGQDVTSRFDPHLLSLKISRNSKDAADQCDISLSDQDGNIVLPQKRDPIIVNIDGQQAFEGFTSDVDYDFSRNGRTLSVSASSADQAGKVKEPTIRHKDDASFADVAKEWGQKAGLQVSVAGSITGIQRPYWFMQTESFMSWGNRMARELGASFKIIGSRAFFVGINEGLSASGKTLTPISGAWGVNLLSGKISPIITRPRFKNVKLSYFDIKKGERVETDVETGIDDVDAALRSVISHASEDHAKQKGKADGKNSDREKGGGSAVILGNVMVEPEANFTLSGVRPGIDGSYRISGVDHSISKAGFTTDLSLKQPQDGAGVDKR